MYVPAQEQTPLARQRSTPIMDPAGKTLVDIASVSRRVFDTLIRYAGRKTVESFQLEKIVVASGAILETLNGALFLGNCTVMIDWWTGCLAKNLKDVWIY